MVNEDRDDRLIRSRDILSSVATSFGFIITSFGLLLALVSRDEAYKLILQNFCLIFIFVVLIFTISVIATIMFNFRRSDALWNFALFFFGLGWISIGVVIVFIFIGYSFGINSLQIQLPEFQFYTTSLLQLITSIIFFLYWRRRHRES